MKLSAILSRRLRLINLPGAILMMLLQRTPVVSLVATTEEMVIASPMGTLLKAVVATVSALGAVNTMVGATPLVPSTGTASGISVASGSSVSVFYTVNGTQTPPMSWKITGTVPGGLNFSGLTAAGSVDVGSLHLSGTPTTAGTYNLTLQTFEFTNNGGSASPIYNYTITVTGSSNTAPAFTTQPASQSVTVGAAVTFTAAATGSPAPTFQWQKDGTNIAGATSTSYSIASASAGDAGSYTIIASNSAGSVTSNAASLTVSVAASAPAFTTQPASQSVASGGAVTFTAAATGSPTPTFQWKKDGANIAGATSTSYSIASVTNGDSGSYTVVANNSAGSITSNAAMLTVTAVNSAPAFTTQPANQTVVAGNSAMFSVVATGSPTPNFQWRKNGVNILGATQSSFSIANAAASDAGSYTVVATNFAGSVVSNAAVLTVNPLDIAPSFTKQPNAQSVRVGHAVTFTTTASGAPSPTFQWQKNGANINGATNPSYTIASALLSNSGSYTVVATNRAGSISSSSAVLIVQGAPKGDFNGDGQTDILWQNIGSGDHGLWIMDGPVPAAWITLPSISLDWRIVGTADFTGDGQNDILWENVSSGDHGLWAMNGTTPAAWINLPAIALDWRIVGTGDFNGDGQMDILWENVGSGDRGMWIMNGTTPTAWINLPSIALDWRIVGTGDFNGDNQVDILWENVGSGDRGMWIMNGATPAAWINLPSISLNWLIAGTGDFNGDGQVDILWENSSSGDRGTWIMNGTVPAAWINLPSISLAWRISQ